jgi:formylglycine-generating enzyme required for sulfatase activity
MLASVMTTPDGAKTVDEASIIEVPLPGGVSMAFVRIPPGTFMMGETEYDDEKPIHQVTLTHGLWMAVTEATQEQWKAVMGKNPSHFKGDPNLPVDHVNWEDCVEFAARLGDLPGDEVPGKPDLPTEAEWEYACRADSTMEWSFGDHESGLDDYAWFGENSGSKDPSVEAEAAERLGTLRHARERVGMVQGLVRPYKADRSGILKARGPACRSCGGAGSQLGNPLCVPQRDDPMPRPHRGCAAGAALA